MARAYQFVREHLDDVVALARLIFARRRLALDTPAMTIAEDDLEIADLGERIELRLGASHEAGFELPFDRLRTAFQLNETEQRTLEILVALAVSSEVRELANSPHGGSSLEQIDDLVYAHPSVRDRFAEDLSPDGRLLGYRLIELAATTESRFVRSVRVADRIVDLLYGANRAIADLTAARLVDPGTSELLLPEDQIELARRALRRHETTGGGPILLLRGPDGSGRRSIVGTIARELGARLLVVSSPSLPGDRISVALMAIQREAILARAVIVFAAVDEMLRDDEAHQRDRALAIASAFASYPGPVAMTATTGGPVTGLFGARGVTVIELAIPPEQTRVALWSRHLDAAMAPDAARRYRLTGGQIERAAESARSRGDQMDLTMIHEGVRTILDGELSTLGVRLAWTQRWDELVLPDDSREELTELVDRVKYRRQVIDDWGFGGKVAKGLGVAALFHGPPGTGKTMAAGLIANELGLDLYQIDVSRLVSKYIGETEKNLARVFDAAEAGHAVLLFDEADSLFAKRTEVKSSVDRYANLEVNYLLQRMESFNGIAILTTNFESSLDEAFRRRLAYRIHFPIPDHDERAKLWKTVIPEGALGPGVDFKVLAQRFEMTGGYIKNAALRAAFIAAGEHKKISMQHLLRAANAEYASLGKVMTQGMGRGL
ncbi:MAG: ATP-binding protein [Deltaproteobacteria bacterium]|nr:ATP-binding protein [Deltaproteobacteria bacterium]